MKKVFINQIEKIGKLAKKVGKESPDKMSVFIYYEPKAPKAITENRLKK